VAQDTPIESLRDRVEKAKKFNAWFTDSFRAFQDYNNEVVDMLKMLAGDQWPDADKEELERQNRPPIVINKMLAPVLLVSGIQRRTRQEPHLLPAESGDVEATEIMSGLVHWVEKQNQAQEIDSQVFFHKIAVGLAYWKYWVDFDEDVEGQIKMARLRALDVFPDPQFLLDGWENAQYVIHAPWFPVGKALEDWPEFRDEIEAMLGPTFDEFRIDEIGLADVGDPWADKRLWWDEKTKRIRILEVWYKRRVRVPLAIFDHPTAGILVESDPDRVRAMREQAAQLPPEEAARLTFTRKTATQVRVAHVLGGVLLDDEESPYEIPEFPIFPAVGYFTWKYPFGMAQIMKDPQREKNKRRSKLTELVGRMPLSGFLVKEGSLPNPEEIEEYGAGNGVVLTYAQEKPELIPPPPIPTALVHLEARADAEINQTVNVHAEMLGDTTQRTVSGRAIEARQRGGLITQEALFDTFAQEKARAIKFLIRLIQKFVMPTRAARILGALTVREPANAAARFMQQNPAQVIAFALSRAYDTDYDVEIAQKPAEPSVKFGIWQTLLEWVEKLPGMVPPDVMVEAAVEAGVITKQIGDKMKLAFQQAQAPQQNAVPGGSPANPPG
jgi:hypothetical protein